MVSERGQLLALLGRHGLRTNKALGQHFLADEEVLRSIVEATGAGDGTDVVEIGSGPANLSVMLALTGARVTGIELDRRLEPLHREVLLGWGSEIDNRLTFYYGDALEFDYCGAAERAAAEGRKLIIAGNIPYQITSPLIMGVLESGAAFHTMVLMMQKEVGERLTAGPGGRDNGAISIKVQYYTRVEQLFNVGAEAFVPPPQVESQVLRFMKRKTKSGIRIAESGLEKPGFFRVVDGAFMHRRKTVPNSLAASGMGWTREQVEEALREMGLGVTVRAEQLGVEEFMELGRRLEINRENT